MKLRLSGFALTLVLLSGCALPSSTPATATRDIIATVESRLDATVEARVQATVTRIQQAPSEQPSTPTPQPTPTASPTLTPTPTQTPMPTYTATATLQPTPTAASTQGPVPTPTPALSSEDAKDVLINLLMGCVERALEDSAARATAAQVTRSRVTSAVRVGSLQEWIVTGPGYRYATDGTLQFVTGKWVVFWSTVSRWVADPDDPAAQLWYETYVTLFCPPQ